MQEELEAALRRWQEADKLAQGNTDLLQPYSLENSEIAHERMKALSRAERSLVGVISVTDPSELPVPLAIWLATYPGTGKESGCGHCWSSSAADEQKHSACVERIRRFFAAIEDMRVL